MTTPLPPQYDGALTSISPAERAVAVTPSDSADLSFVTRGIYVGGAAGDIKVTTLGNDDVVLPNVPTQDIFPIQARRIWSTGTTATDIIALA